MLRRGRLGIRFRRRGGGKDGGLQGDGRALGEYGLGMALSAVGIFAPEGGEGGE